MPRWKKTIPPRWRKLLDLLPGYDSVKTAEDCWFDADEAEHVCGFYPTCLRHIEGVKAGKPFILEPWQRGTVGALFGWKRPDGSRRYRTAFLLVPRKNGKTPIAAGIGDYMTFCDGEIGAQNFCAAASADQAAQLFRYAEGMVRQSPMLFDRAQILGGVGQRQINDTLTRSFLKVLSAEADTAHGGTPHLVIVDEVHAIKGRNLVDVLRTSMASANRRQPLLLFLTTQDFDRPSICNETYDYAAKVRDGVVDDPYFLPVLFEASVEDDWREEATWRKANPNFDVSVSGDFLREECKRAQVVPSYENTFKRLHLNLRTEQDQRWLSLDAWDLCADEPDIVDGETCFAAMDLSSVRDTTTLVLLFPRTKSLLMHCWAPQQTIEMRAQYEGWVNAGFLERVDGASVDYSRVRKKMSEYAKRFTIRQVAFDPWNAEHLARQLEEEDGFALVKFRQGFASMSAPSKEFERLVLAGAFRHGGNPVLRWMAGSAAIESDAAGNIKPTKAKSTGRIDGIVCAVMATGLMMLAPEEYGSIYETRGLDFI